MRFPRSQQGMSIVSTIIVLSVLAFFVIVLFKIVPHYLDNKALDRIIMAVETDQATGSAVRTPAAFYAHVSKGMQINSINDLSAQDAMKVTQSGSEFHVHMQYERREPILKNIDLVVKFDKEYRVRPR